MNKVISNIDPEINRVCEEMISAIQADHFEIENHIASPEKLELYQSVAAGDYSILMSSVQKMHLRFHFLGMLSKAISEIITLPYRRCAVYTSASRVANIWIEIEEDDNQTQRELLRIQSRINAMFNSKGVSVAIDIFEPSEEASIPSNFKVLPKFPSA